MFEPTRTYVWLEEVRDMVSVFEVLGREEEDFYIRHANDWFRQSMRDGEGHLTGCLDWEWAYATTKAEAFSSPLNLHIDQPWTEGDNALSSDELLMVECFDKLGRPDLGECIRGGDSTSVSKKRCALTGRYSISNGEVTSVGFLVLLRAQGQQVAGPFQSDEESEAWIESLVEKRRENGELDEVRAAWMAYVNVKGKADKREEEIRQEVVAEYFEKLKLVNDGGVEKE
ncbi:hypothetical protein IAR50_007445 [Cryptococcus sp. DSM 104548]